MWAMRSRQLILTLTTLIWSVLPGLAYFQDVAVGARPAGMGEAFVGVADDTHAMLFNPAGLVRMHSWELSAMYADLYAGLDLVLADGSKDYSGYHFLAVGVPGSTGKEAWGGAWSRLYSPLYSENVGMLSYAHRVWDALGLDFGVTAKALQWSVASNEYTEDKAYYPARSKMAMTYDLGLMVSPYKDWTVGVAGENLWPADVGLLTTEYVPIIWRAGATYLWHTERWNIDSLLTSLEMEWRNFRYTPKLGLESWWFKRSVALRGGVHSEAATVGMGVRYAWPELNMSLQLDYAFTYPFLIQDTWGSHRLELTLGWEPPRPVMVVPPAVSPSPGTSGTEGVASNAGNSLPAAVAAPPGLPGTPVPDEPGRPTTLPPGNSTGANWPIGNNQDRVIIGYDGNLLKEYANLPDSLRTVTKLERILQIKTGIRVEHNSYNASELLTALQQGEVDMVLFSSTVLKNAQQQNLVDSVLMPIIYGKDTHRLCLVVRDDNALNTLASLNNTRLGYISWDDLRQLRTQFQLGTVQFQEQHQLPRSRDAIVALQLHEVDVVLADERILREYVKIEIKQPQPVGIKALAFSRPFSNSPVIFRKNLAPGKGPKLQKLRNALLSLHLDAEAKQEMQFFDIERLIMGQ